MALKDRLRGSKRSKRFGNVSDIFNTKIKEEQFSSTDSEMEEDFIPKKVRDGLSIKNLMKDGENFKIDGDHIYSCGKSQYYEGNRKKRKISEASDDKPSKQKCFSKNAVMARLNRERKKKYIMSLEKENEELKKENDDIKKKTEKQDEDIEAMKMEIMYLKGLLANSKELGQILTNLRATTDLPITSSMVARNEEPRIKTVTCSSNFPIMLKDINLNSSSDKSNSSYEAADLENCLFDFNNVDVEKFYDESHSDLFFNFNSQNLNSELSNLTHLDEAEKIPTVGICLHVNKKSISVEVCSICNSKANSTNPPSSVNLF